MATTARPLRIEIIWDGAVHGTVSTGITRMIVPATEMADCAAARFLRRIAARAIAYEIQDETSEREGIADWSDFPQSLALLYPEAV
jgi:hypothetical protein